MGVLGSVVQAFVLAMLDAGHDLSLRRAIALQLVGDQHARRAALLLQELAHQSFGRLLVTPALDQNVEHHAMLIDGSPKPVFPAIDCDHHFIEEPLVDSQRLSTSGSSMKVRHEGAKEEL